MTTEVIAALIFFLGVLWLVGLVVIPFEVGIRKSEARIAAHVAAINGYTRTVTELGWPFG